MRKGTGRDVTSGHLGLAIAQTAAPAAESRRAQHRPNQRERILAAAQRILEQLGEDDLLRVAEFAARLRHGSVR